MKLATKSATFGDIKLIDAVMTGEGSQMAGCDRRTFIAWAKKLGIEPVMVLESPKGNKLIYKRLDAEKIARAYKAFQEKQRSERQ